MERVSNSQKTQVALVVIAMLVHFCIVLIYNAPQKWFSEKLNFHVRQYMVPVFHQNFKIFAPEPPTSNNYLAFRCQFEEGTYSKWQAPDLVYLHLHQENRFSYYGKKYNVYESIGRNLYYTYYQYYQHLPSSLSGKKQQAIRKAIQSPSYKLAERYAKNKAIEAFPNQPIEAIQIAYLFNYIEKDSTDALFFPPIDIDNE